MAVRSVSNMTRTTNSRFVILFILLDPLHVLTVGWGSRPAHATD